MIDIYKLGENEGKGSIRAIMNSKLKKEINTCIKELKQYGFFVNFCKRTKTDYKTLWKYLNKHNYIPLYVLAELEKLSNAKFQKHIKYLEYGTGSSKRRTKVIKELNEELAAMVGAFIADGHLKERICLWNNRNATHYELVFREGYESNVIALANWINNVFKIGVKPKKEKNHYSIYISNKIVFRYFNKIFGFKSGRKTETVSIPNILKTTNRKIKISLIKGILMFDGSVSRKKGYIDLLSKSSKLIVEVSEIIRRLSINPSHTATKPDNYGRYRFTIGRQFEIKKSLIFFEEDTEKHIRLKKIMKTFKN
jgi:hypothetical protein|tara:strand:- start:310 stop:1239 length:930 start_codon:yes stop_codon:yes gene_type:complete